MQMKLAETLLKRFAMVEENSPLHKLSELSLFKIPLHVPFLLLQGEEKLPEDL
jgi:hypothetical protein